MTLPLRRTYAVVAALLVLSFGLFTAPHSFAAAKDGPKAPFEGTVIRLDQDWGAARACVIWEQAHATACFRSAAALEQHIASVERTLAPTTALTPMASCSNALYLYQDINYSGRMLVFRDRGYWQNLTNYNFNDQLSSYSVGACGVHLAENINGGGAWYPGNTGAYAYATCMCVGSTPWNDRVSSIYIQ